MAVTRVVSIEVTDQTTRAIEMGFGKKDQTIYKAVSFDTPAHTVADGVIENVDVFGKELSTQLRGAGIHTKDCIFSLNSSKVISREVTTADLKDEQIPDFIESQKGEYFPMDTTGFIMVHRIIERNREAKTMRLIVFGVPGRIVQSYQEIAAIAGLKVLSMDYTGNAQYQWLQNSNHKDIDIYLNIGEQSTTLTILEKRLLAIQRNLNFGSNLLADRVIGSGYYQEDLNRKTAMKKLAEDELMFASIGSTGRMPRGETEAAENLNNLKAALTEGMKQFINNVSRVLEYYHSKSKGSAEIAKIYIGGTGSRIKGLKNLLENEFIGVEIIVLEQLPDLKLHHSVAKADFNTTEFISCIGAVDCSLTFVLPSEKQKLQKTVILCAAALVLIICVAVVIIYIGKSKYDAAVKDRDNYQNKVQQLEATGIEALEAQYNDTTARILDVTTFDEGTVRTSEVWNEVLTEIETHAVSSMTLSSLSHTDDMLTMNVAVSDKTAAAKLLMQLAQIPYFKKVSTNAIMEDNSDVLPVVTFSINCQYDKKYYNYDVNGDGKVDVNGDDKDGNGIVDIYDFCGDINNDAVTDIRDWEIWKRTKKENAFKLLEQDINRDGVIDVLDDITGDGNIDAFDRALYAKLESGVFIDPITAPNYNLTEEQLTAIVEAYRLAQMPVEEEVVAE